MSSLLSLAFNLALTLTLLLLLSSAHAQFIAAQSFHLRDFNGTVVSDGTYGTCTNNFFKISLGIFRSRLLRARGRVFPATLSSNVVVLDVGGTRLLVDTGQGYVVDFPTGGQLVKSLAKAGIAPTSIDAVLLTHAHIDHFQGLVTLGNDNKPKATFPNARVYVTRVDHKYWSSSAPVRFDTTLLPQDILNAWAARYVSAIAFYQNRVTLVDDMEEPLPGVLFRLTPGHSPGHAVVEVSRGESRLVVMGDLFHSPIIQVPNVGTGIFFDSNSTQAAQSRRAAFRRFRDSGDLLLSFHSNFPGLGYIRRKKRYGFEWIYANIGDLQPNPLECPAE